MSETAGGHTISRPDDFRMDSVGRTICGAEIKIDNPDEDGKGEVSQFETSLLIHSFYQLSCLFIWPAVFLLLWLL